jgi:hypothetical protein
MDRFVPISDSAVGALYCPLGSSRFNAPPWISRVTKAVAWPILGSVLYQFRKCPWGNTLAKLFSTKVKAVDARQAEAC